jgi:arginase
VDRSVTCLRSRTSDRISASGEGAEALARALGGEVLGTPQAPRDGAWEDDLDAAQPVLEAADPSRVLTASDCTICIASLPRLDADVAVVWLDAHADFNSPETTASQFLGGMCLAGACGVWETGWGTIDPSRVVLSGCRDIEDGEQALLDEHGVPVVDPAELPARVAGRRVFVHLDMDVTDITGTAFPAPGGWTFAELRAVLASVAEAADEVVGLEVTAFSEPERAGELASILRETVL